MTAAGDLKSRSLRGGAITFTAQIVRFAMQMAATVILARLLSPEAFGLIAMIAALMAILDLFKEFGLSAATIQRPEISQQQLSALFWTNAAIGAVIATTLYFVAPAIARFYGHSELTEITRWLALGFFISALTVQHWALLRRRMNFSAIAILETGSDAAALAIAVVLAWYGFGFWSLVVQRIVSLSLSLIGSLIVARWAPGLPRGATDMPSLLSYGASVTGYNLVTVAARSVDQVIVGSLWGAATLGLYERAAKLLLVPLNNLNNPLYAVAMPTFSRLVDEPVAYRQMFLAMIQRFAMVTMVPAVLIAVTADWVTVLLFGPNWIAAAPFAACFALSAAFLPVSTALGLLYLTQNRPREMLRAGMLDALLTIALMGIGIPFGAVGLALAQAVGGLFIRLPLALYLSGKKGPVSSSALGIAIGPSLAAAVTAGLAVVVLRWLAPVNGLGAVTGIALCGSLGMLVALGVLGGIPASRQTLRQLLPRRRAADDQAATLTAQMVPPTRIPS
jgi:PST family polysaccharide transporter